MNNTDVKKLMGDIKADTVFAYHNNQKSVDFVKSILEYCNQDVVLDLFGGSGTTLIACEELGLKCYMLEVEPKFVQVIIDRYEKLTGDKAIKL